MFSVRVVARNDVDSLGFLVADVSRAMRRAFERCLEGSALTLAQARALVYIARNEGIRQVDLAELLEIQPMTVARLIDQLVAERLVERRPHPTDRRVYQVHLTAAAAPHLAAIDQVVATIRRQAARGLDRDQLATVLAALRTMRDNFSTR